MRRVAACPRCAQTIHLDAKSCQHCGKRVAKSAFLPVLFMALLIGCACIAVSDLSRAPWADHGPGMALASVPHLTPPPPMVTMEKYEALQTGLTYSQAEETIGLRGEQMASSGTMGQTFEIYHWTNPDGSGITAQFQNGVLVTKAQFGLR